MPRRPATGASSPPLRAPQLKQRVAALELELAHRSQETQRRFRNMLAMIRAIIRQTALDSDDLEDYRAQLEGRIASVTRIQSLLLADHDAGVDLFMMVADEALLAGLDDDAIQCHGESAQLAAPAASLVALLLHELVHIAASGSTAAWDQPLATISREIADGNDGRFLCIHWLQHGQHAHQRFESAAFGWIEDALAYELNARIEKNGRDGGLCRSYTIPLALALARAG